MKNHLNIKPDTLAWIHRLEESLAAHFKEVDETALYNQAKVLAAFQQAHVMQGHFASTSGYGYGDGGREKLANVFAYALGAEKALVRPQIASGTHAIALALRGLLKPGARVLCASGQPYDTILETLGLRGDSPASLSRWGVSVDVLELAGQELDTKRIAHLAPNATLLYVQRSRGYSWRNAIALENMQKTFRAAKRANPELQIFVDNCYGEFVQTIEPCEVGADVIAGSLIKNPGGGIAPTGGYIAGTQAAIANIAEGFTAAGVGDEVGSYAASYTPFFQGLFLAPHVVAQSVKGGLLFAAAYEALGYDVLPNASTKREDIILSLRLESAEALARFCRAIQSAAPVDSTAVPIASEMPGYDVPVIMAAGTFVQGASIELSADGPMKPPYVAYLQGGLTYEHAKLALALAINDAV